MKGRKPTHVVELKGLPSFHELARIRRLVHDKQHDGDNPACPFCPLRADEVALRFRAEVPAPVSL